MVYVRGFFVGLFAVAMLVTFCDAFRGFEKIWDYTAVRKSPVWWLVIFVIFVAGFYWEFQRLSN